MSSLQAALQGFDEDLVQEIVADYEERFRIGATQGKTEEQIVAELGSVEGLVEELGELQSQTHSNSGTRQKKAESQNADQTENTDNTSNTEDTEDNTYYRGSYTREKSFSESLDGLMKMVGKVVDDAMKEAGQALEYAKEQMEIHVEEAKRRRAAGENVDYDVNIRFNGSTSEKDSGMEAHVESSGEGMTGCTLVVVDADCADVTIRRTTDDVPRAFCHYYSHKTSMAYPFYAYQDGNTFRVGIRREQQEKKSGYFQFSWSPSIEIELDIPDSVQCVTVNSLSGNITAEELVTEKIKLHSTSGDMNINYFSGKECFAETLSGDVTLEKSGFVTAAVTTKSGDCTVSKLKLTSLTVNTMSGDIEADGIVGDDVRFSTMSGDANPDDIEAKAFTLSTASGDLDITDCRGGLLQVSSASGDIDISGDFKEYRVNTQSGDVDVTSRHDADFMVHATSGDVEITVTETKARYEVATHSVSGECYVSGHQNAEGALPGEKVYRVEGKSISGDISIHFN